MKILAISGSPRKGGNTEQLLGILVQALKAQGVDSELVSLADHNIQPCKGCRRCKDTKKCCINDDFHGIYEKMVAANGFIVGSPTYYGSATPQIMALLDRAGSIAAFNGRAFSRKIGGAVAISRRAGHNFTFAQLMMFFGITGMIVPGSTYWNVGVALQKGDIVKDIEAIQTIENFAKEITWLLHRLYR